jgi:hypothetical protein
MLFVWAAYILTILMIFCYHLPYGCTFLQLNNDLPIVKRITAILNNQLELDHQAALPISRLRKFTLDATNSLGYDPQSGRYRPFAEYKLKLENEHNDHHANNNKKESIEEVGAAVRGECKSEVSSARPSVSSNDSSAVVYTKTTSLSESDEEDQGFNGSGPPPASRKRKVAREASTGTSSASDTKSKHK